LDVDTGRVGEEERKISLKKQIWSFQNLGYVSKFYLCSSFTPHIIRTTFPEKIRKPNLQHELMVVSVLRIPVF
jgi:hypothetical protein